MSLPVLRSPDSLHLARYQLWTDALCLREMAHQAPNNYLRSMCVRNAIIAAWTTLEMACRDALSVTRFSANDFKRGLNDALANLGKPTVDFGSGVWQLLGTRTLQRRNECAHAGVRLNDRFPPVSHANEAVADVRNGVRDIYQRVGKRSPTWIEPETAIGWPRSGLGMSATPTIIRQGADPQGPATIKISLITPAGREQPIDYLRSDTPEDEILGAVEDTLGKLNAPFSGIRIYRGSNLIHDESFEVRG